MDQDRRSDSPRTDLLQTLLDLASGRLDPSAPLEISALDGARLIELGVATLGRGSIDDAREIFELASLLMPEWDLPRRYLALLVEEPGLEPSRLAREARGVSRFARP
jgi:hypothetical protein